METKRFFDGKWELVELYINREHGWASFKKYNEGKVVVWEFRESGQYIMYSEGAPVKTELYVYVPERQLLFLGEYYLVKHICDDEYYLYCMDDIMTEPEECRLRAKVRKIAVVGGAEADLAAD